MDVVAVEADIEIDNSFGTESEAHPGKVAFGGDSEAAANGRAIHNVFDAHLRELNSQDPKWQPSLKSGPNRPDGFFDGDPIELKPNTPSGIRAGIRQLDRYVGAFGASQGYLYTYDTNGNISFNRIITP